MQHVPPLAAAVNPPRAGAGPIASGDSCSDQVTWGLRQQAGQAAGSLPQVAQHSGDNSSRCGDLGPPVTQRSGDNIGSVVTC